ncbi:MAG TPA: hypothetical protein PK781_05040 [Terrimesophilobacter sp.]|nr:hypothetical protein [Terrimesophilobacter sp.]HRP99810.1 hypothetical protein [Terrimesophilobacter sp.]
MEFTVGLDTITTLLTIVAGVVGLGATVLASNGRTRTELKSDIAELRTELKHDIATLRTELKDDIAELRVEVKGDISRLDDRVYALAAGLAPRLVPDRDHDPA